MTVKLRCPVCGDIGTLMKKETITKIAGRRYRYEKWYVYHNRSKGTKKKMVLPIQEVSRTTRN
jgi:hypothetical protein